MIIMYYEKSVHAMTCIPGSSMPRVNSRYKNSDTYVIYYINKGVMYKYCWRYVTVLPFLFRLVGGNNCVNIASTSNYCGM
jgi:hypothetical protein